MGANFKGFLTTILQQFHSHSEWENTRARRTSPLYQNKWDNERINIEGL
ncbi:hypothetical protein PUN28_019764 [Cardiocondyla obscurior]|uniref:Uncharacterized protein n=1 Tax=Cardiocondyla obscurior TaxID=286306 RepID=A0AAW2E8J4_9HYME